MLDVENIWQMGEFAENLLQGYLNQCFSVLTVL